MSELEPVPSAEQPTWEPAEQPAGEAARAGAGAGPLVLLVPVLALLGFALWRQAAGGAALVPRHRTEAPPVESGETAVDGWAATFPWPAGSGAGRVEARLAPLHAEPRRQAFDAAALAARFGLPPGAPWRLTLRALPAAADGADTPPLDLADLTVEGFQALVAHAPAASPGPSPGTPADPVRTLLAAPRGVLGAGREVDLYLWRPQGAEAPDASGPVALRAAGRELTRLVPTRLSAPRTSSALARLDPRAGAEGAPR